MENPPAEAKLNVKQVWIVSLAACLSSLLSFERWVGHCVCLCVHVCMHAHVHGAGHGSGNKWTRNLSRSRQHPEPRHVQVCLWWQAVSAGGYDSTMHSLSCSSGMRSWAYSSSLLGAGGCRAQAGNLGKRENWGCKFVFVVCFTEVGWSSRDVTRILQHEVMQLANFLWG